MTLHERLFRFAKDDAFDRIIHWKDGDDTALSLVLTLRAAFPGCTVTHVHGSREAEVKDPETGERVTVNLSTGGPLRAKVI